MSLTGRLRVLLPAARKLTKAHFPYLLI